MSLVIVLLLGLASAATLYAFSGADEKARKRIRSVAKPAKPAARGRALPLAQGSAQKRKSLAVLLKQGQGNRAATKERPSLRRRLEQAGFAHGAPRTYWLVCALLAGLAGSLAIGLHQGPAVVLLAAFAAGLGLPRWGLGFLARRRESKFTENFAGAIDVIVRSVKSGLPTQEALRIVAREAPEPVGGEFRKLVESMRLGVTLEQGLKRMRQSMPTMEVGFFSIVMTIQAKAGGNLSEALGNLSGVLRERKRLKAKIKAMSSEAKASAMIIGSLPPAVMGLVFLTTPNYIMKLFSERSGNLMLAACVLWMGCGILVMRKMVNFKH